MWGGAYTEPYIQPEVAYFPHDIQIWVLRSPMQKHHLSEKLITEVHTGLLMIYLAFWILYWITLNQAALGIGQHQHFPETCASLFLLQEGTLQRDDFGPRSAWMSTQRSSLPFHGQVCCVGTSASPPVCQCAY